MKLTTAILTTTLAASLWAQGRGPAVVSPEVSSDGRVTFRLRAPNAKEVAVTGVGQRLAMQKNEQGVWSATTDALKPDIYTYSFSVDGTTFSDPANPLMKTAYGNGGQSMVRVPAGSAPAWAPAEGPRGIVSHHEFKSAIIGAERDYYVYTPPNYDPNRREAYPVLFLLHGLGDDAAGWLNVGSANTILDNLINQGKAKPMVMVNTLGYGTPDGPTGAMGANMIPTFAKSLVEEVLPQVEKAYHVSKDRNQRAIAGLSMGGAESLFTGLNYLDHFAYIGSFSGAFVMWPRATSATAEQAPAGGGRGGGRGGAQTRDAADFEKIFPSINAKTNSQLKLVWIACGLDDSLLTVNRQFKSWLKTKDIAFTEVEAPGFAHVWPLWRQNLTDLAPLLFPSKK
ncbi:MAG TPA: alpha/beta hydrolase-fold protein [Bryobacteraceae bacterium]|jgi:enterochelin esterase family protein